MHNRRLVIGGVALTKARVRPAKAAAAAMARVRDELEQELIESNYLKDAPFTWVSLIIREGLIDKPEPHYGKIDRKDGELPLAVGINVHRQLNAHENEIVQVYRRATLTALIHAGEKHGLPVVRL